MSFKQDDCSRLPTKQQMNETLKTNGTVDLWVMCIMHLVLRLVINGILILLRNDDPKAREKKIGDIICKKIRSTFKFTTKNIDDAEVAKSDEVALWLSLQEARSFLKLCPDLLKELDATPNEIKLFQYVSAIETALFEWRLLDWRDSIKMTDFEKLCWDYGLLFRKLYGKDVYYSHLSMAHLAHIAKLLATMGLTLKDFALFDLENLHCLAGRYLQWKGTYTHYPSKDGKKWCLPYHPLEHELLKKLMMLEIWTFRAKVEYDVLKGDDTLAAFRKSMIESRRVEHEPRFKMKISEERTVDGVVEVVQVTPKTAQQHRSEAFKALCHNEKQNIQILNPGQSDEEKDLIEDE